MQIVRRWWWLWLIVLLVVGWAPPTPEPLINDVLEPPVSAQGQGVSCPYLIGDVAVGVILPESDGHGEDWTALERARVMKEIVAAGDWWEAREPRAHLEFYYEAHVLPTTYEPILFPQIGHLLWILEVMGELGYDDSNVIDRVYSYNADLREWHDADWAFTVFVVDSSNDVDNKFSDGLFAYAYLGGPFMVMTYGNNGYGIDQMDIVAAHEMGHIFCALDQYYTAYQPCDKVSGVLGIENQNSDYGDCFLSEPSIMKWPLTAWYTERVDRYARGQLGWCDSDFDGILDPVDREVMKTYLPVVVSY